MSCLDCKSLKIANYFCIHCLKPLCDDCAKIGAHCFFTCNDDKKCCGGVVCLCCDCDEDDDKLEKYLGECEKCGRWMCHACIKFYDHHCHVCGRPQHIIKFKKKK